MLYSRYVTSTCEHLLPASKTCLGFLSVYQSFQSFFLPSSQYRDNLMCITIFLLRPFSFCQRNKLGVEFLNFISSSFDYFSSCSFFSLSTHIMRYAQDTMDAVFCSKRHLLFNYLQLEPSSCVCINPYYTQYTFHWNEGSMATLTWPTF